ncbi:hypothetical protein ACOSQ2_006556 [Xanthoceras sorbifolium]
MLTNILQENANAYIIFHTLQTRRHKQIILKNGSVLTIRLFLKMVLSKIIQPEDITNTIYMIPTCMMHHRPENKKFTCIQYLHAPNPQKTAIPHADMHLKLSSKSKPRNNINRK